MTEHHARIDDGTFAPIAALAEAAGKLHVPWFVIGAMGRVLLLERVYGLPHGRATQDVDFGLMVQNWGHFNNLVARLCMDSRFRRDTKLNQRLHFTNDRHIDLIPFGGVESSDRMVHWPPDGNVEMSAAGFREAYDAAERISVNDALPVRVVSAEGLVLLNLMAWRDRHDTHPLRDAADIAYVLRHYKTLLTGKTVLDPHVDLMETEGFELDLAAAHHLGRELKRIASVHTRDCVLGLLDRELATGPDSLLVREIAASSTPVGTERVCDLLNKMRAGMRD